MFLFFSILSIFPLSTYITSINQIKKDSKENGYFNNFDINSWIMSTTIASLDNSRCDIN